MMVNVKDICHANNTPSLQTFRLNKHTVPPLCSFLMFWGPCIWSQDCLLGESVTQTEHPLKF
jgi:hypothetical protein